MNYVQLFEWQQPFDGTQPEIDEAEQRQVARLFRNFVGRAIATQLGDEKYYDDLRWNGARAYLQHLPHADATETEITRFALTERHGGDESIWVSRVTEDHKLAAQRVVPSSTYRIDLVADGYYGPVRRLDDDGLSSRHPIMHEADPKDIARAFRAFKSGDVDPANDLYQAEIDRKHNGEQLEKDMRLNDQPIGMSELKGLMSVIGLACPL